MRQARRSRLDDQSPVSDTPYRTRFTLPEAGVVVRQARERRERPGLFGVAQFYLSLDNQSSVSDTAFRTRFTFPRGGGGRYPHPLP